MLHRGLRKWARASRRNPGRAEHGGRRRWPWKFLKKERKEVASFGQTNWDLGLSWGSGRISTTAPIRLAAPRGVLGAFTPRPVPPIPFLFFWGSISHLKRIP